MIAVLDACSVLNLLLVNYDERYIKYIEKTFDQIIIAPKVFDEIRSNKSDNLIDKDLASQIDILLYSYIIKYVVNPDPISECKFTESATRYAKKNGEFFSVAHSLHNSHIGKVDLMENLLSTHFITDDSPATQDFGYFYRINVIGQIIDTIDLMTLLCLKGHIGKGEVQKYCGALKLLYSRSASLLIQELKTLNEKSSDILTSKQKIALTNLIDILNELSDNSIERIHLILETKELKDIIRENQKIDNLLTDLLSSNFREKIPEINRRINDLDKVWELEFCN